MRCLISSLIFNSLKKQGYTKLSKTFRILGCTYSEFKNTLEKQFTEGMSWIIKANGTRPFTYLLQRRSAFD
jgi:hypothetical protein